jgi:hypothetical protein
MLERPPSRRERRREQHAAAMRRSRRRAKGGVDQQPMTVADAYKVIVDEVRYVPRERWHEIAAPRVAQFVASGQLTQDQAGDVLRMLLLRWTRRRARQREQRARWQRDWRRRVRNGSKLAEVPSAMIELLLASKWLNPHECDDKRAITEALDAFARDAMKKC